MEKNEKEEVFSTVIRAKDARQMHISRGIRKMKVGRLLGTDKLACERMTYANDPRNEGLVYLHGIDYYAGHYVFYAYGKRRLFSKENRVVLVCSLNLDNSEFFPADMVRFEKPKKGATETVLLKKETVDKELFTENRYDRDHTCILEEMSTHRTFSVSKDAIKCIKDVLVNHFRWTNPDGWVEERFTKEYDKEPMFFISHKPEVQDRYGISYPERPPLWGYSIEE